MHWQSRRREEEKRREKRGGLWGVDEGKGRGEIKKKGHCIRWLDDREGK